MKAKMKSFKKNRISGQTSIEYLLIVVVVAMIVIKFKSNAQEKLNMRQTWNGLYTVEQVKKLQFDSLKLYPIKDMKMNHPKRGDITFLASITEDMAIQREITVRTKEVTFLENLKKDDILKAQFGLIGENYIYQGLFINGQPLKKIYYQRRPASWTQPEVFVI